MRQYSLSRVMRCVGVRDKRSENQGNSSILQRLQVATTVRSTGSPSCRPTGLRSKYCTSSFCRFPIRSRRRSLPKKVQLPPAKHDVLVGPLGGSLSTMSSSRKRSATATNSMHSAPPRPDGRVLTPRANQSTRDWHTNVNGLKQREST